MSGDDGFFSSDVFLLILGLIAVVLVVYFALGSVGAWVGNFILDGVPVP